MNGLDLTGEIERLFSNFLDWLPTIVQVLIILIIGYIVSRLLKSLTISGLRRLGFDRRLYESPADNIVRRVTSSPSRTVGNFVYWLGMIVTITIAIFALNIAPLNAIVQGVYGYIPNILGAIFILALALAAATAIGAFFNRLMGDTPTGKFLATAIPVVILSIAIFATLEQLQIAPTIVTITYVALIGSVALGFAIALGLGSKDVVSRVMDEAYGKGRKNLDQIREDVQVGKRRGEEKAEEVKRKARG